MNLTKEPKTDVLRARCTAKEKEWVRSLVAKYDIDESDIVRIALRKLRKGKLTLVA
jgi:hypothetical protein